MVNADVWPNNVAKILKGESKIITCIIRVGVFSQIRSHFEFPEFFKYLFFSGMNELGRKG